MLFTAYFCTNAHCSIVQVDTGALWFLFVCLWASAGLFLFSFVYANADDHSTAMHEDYMRNCCILDQL